MKQSDTVKKLAMAGVLTAVAVVGSLHQFSDFWKQMCTGTAYGKYSGSGCYLAPWMGRWYCICVQV